MTKQLILTALLAAATTATRAQTMTLDECIRYAQEHNITVKQRAGSLRQSEVQLSTERNSWLPTLDASAGENFSFGRSLTASNTYTNTSTSSTSFGLNAGLQLFTGGRIINSIRLARLNLEAATADLEKAKNDLGLNVAAAYMQILYNKEITAVAERQIDIDSMQVERLRTMLANGKASGADLSQQQATLAQSRTTLTDARNQLSLARLTLSQLLELPSPEGFDVATLDTTALNAQTVILPLPDAIFQEAMTNKPEIAAADLRLKAADRNIAIARAGLLPQLSAFGGLSTNYYKTSGYPAESFGDQLNHNFGQSFGFSLSYNIFDRFSTRNSVRNAKIERDNQRLAVEDTRKTLYKEVQQAYYDATAARAKLNSCQAAMASAEDAYTLMKAKYENGKANITEFNEQKNTLLKTSSDLAQAKYEWLYRLRLIDFYRGR